MSIDQQSGNLPGPDSGQTLSAINSKPRGDRDRHEADANLQEPSGSTQGSAIFLDISDLLEFLNDNHHVTGIQRVQSCIVHELLSGRDASTGARLSAGHNIVVAYCDQDAQKIYAISSNSVAALIALLLSADPTQADVHAALERVRVSAIAISPKPRDVYIILGAYWIGNDYTRTLLGLKKNDVRIGVYVYDLIPLTHPQFVSDSTRQAVLEKFGDIMLLVDFVLTISEFVASEVEAALRDDFGRAIPLFAVPLAHELPELSLEARQPDIDFAATLPKEFVLCVCTLEGRKNHRLLLHVWQALKRKYADKIPHLVLVGKWGWQIDEFRAQLIAQRNLDGMIIVLGKVSDAQLVQLYQNCLFTLFPSFVEGWGLPVGESLVYGKPCIASDASSIPEVGGDFCRYINPDDVAGAIAQIERVIVDREDLRKWTERVVRDFRPRTWAMVAQNFLAKVDAAAPADARQAKQIEVTLDSGRIYRLTRDALYGPNSSWRDRALNFVCSQGWHRLEHRGVWSSERTARMEFGVRLPPATRIRLLVELRVTPIASFGSLLICDAAGVETRVHFSDARRKWVAVESETDADGNVSLLFSRSGEVTQPETARELYFGVSAIGFHPTDDLVARISLLESLALFGPAPSSNFDGATSPSGHDTALQVPRQLVREIAAISQAANPDSKTREQEGRLLLSVNNPDSAAPREVKQGILARFRQKALVRKRLEVLARSGLFDSQWYLAAYPDVAATKSDPATHFVTHGSFELRDPGPLFDSKAYFFKNPDVRDTLAEPVFHYILYGRYEGRCAWRAPQLLS